MNLKNKQIKWDSTIDVDGHPIVNVGSPLDDTSVFRQIDFFENSHFKKAAAVATTEDSMSGVNFAYDTQSGELTLSGLASGAVMPLIDGVELLVGDRVLIKDQESSNTSGTMYNGVWEVISGTTTTVTLKRPLDVNPVDRLFGATFTIVQGSVNAGKIFQCSSTENELSQDIIKFRSVAVDPTDVLIDDQNLEIISGPSVQDFAETADQALSLLNDQVSSLAASGLPPYQTEHNETFNVDEDGWTEFLTGTGTITVSNDKLIISDASSAQVGNTVLDELGPITESVNTIYETIITLPSGQATSGNTNNYFAGLTLHATDGNGNLQATGITAQIHAIYDGVNDADLFLHYGEVGSTSSIPLNLKINQRDTFSIRFQLVADPQSTTYFAYFFIDGKLKGVVTGDYSVLQLDTGTRLVIDASVDVGYSVEVEQVISWKFPVGGIGGGSANAELPPTSVETIVDATIPPSGFTAVILDPESPSVDPAYGPANPGDIAVYDGSQWKSYTPPLGWLCYLELSQFYVSYIEEQPNINRWVPTSIDGGTYEAVAAVFEDTFTDTPGAVLTSHIPDNDPSGLGWSSTDPSLSFGDLVIDSTGTGVTVPAKDGEGYVNVANLVGFPSSVITVELTVSGVTLNGSDPNATAFIMIMDSNATIDPNNGPDEAVYVAFSFGGGSYAASIGLVDQSQSYSYGDFIFPASYTPGTHLVKLIWQGSTVTVSVDSESKVITSVPLNFVPERLYLSVEDSGSPSFIIDEIRAYT